jgi:hypothetical protein
MFKVTHSTCRCDHNPNCALLFGWICIQRLKVALSFAPGRHGAVFGPVIGGSRHEGCSMKRKSTICGAREDKDARTVIKEHGGEVAPAVTNGTTAQRQG